MRIINPRDIVIIFDLRNASAGMTVTLKQGHMALIKCIECGREISDKAAVCLGCGAPITITTSGKCIQDSQGNSETSECYLLMIDGESAAQGPYTFHELLVLLKAKQIPDTALIRKPNEESWEFVTVLREQSTNAQHGQSRTRAKLKPSGSGSVRPSIFKRFAYLCLALIGIQLLLGTVSLFEAVQTPVFASLRDSMMLAVTIVFVCGFYFLPSAIAYDRKKRNFAAITVLNLCLGWTLLGWVGALIWQLRRISRVKIKGCSVQQRATVRLRF